MPKNAVCYREFTDEDYPAVLALWRATVGVGLSASDQPEQIRRFLERNPDLSFVALDERRLVGAVLCGHDGRRAYIHHLAVDAAYRGQGIGRQLVARCLERVKQEGILKCHLFVFNENDPAISFWERIGWIRRTEISMMSKIIEV